MSALTLPTGRTLPLAYLAYDAGLNRFFYSGIDVTPYMTRSQMLEAAPHDFDVERANREASDAARDAAGRARVPDTSPKSFLDTPVYMTFRGIGEDVVKLATDTRNFLGIGVENTGNGSPFLRWALLIGAGLLLWKIGAFDWLRKKLTA